MKVMVDLNVIVDVLQRREQFLLPSAKLCDVICAKRCEGIIASHAVTTLFYISRRSAGKAAADKALDWLFATLDVVAADKTTFLTAKTMKFNDFEDAVVAASALKEKCDFIATRNIGDFRNSPLKAMTPEELLSIIGQ